MDGSDYYWTLRYSVLSAGMFASNWIASLVPSDGGRARGSMVALVRSFGLVSRATRGDLVRTKPDRGPGEASHSSMVREAIPSESETLDLAGTT